MKIHITKQGESIDTIANTYAVSKQDLTGINPHVNLASDLVPGLKLKIPDASRAEKNEHIEKFYPNLDHEKHLKEQAVPIGLKPLNEDHAHGHHTSAEVTHPTHPPHSLHQAPHHETTQEIPHHESPWGHLGEHTTHLNPESMHHYPWNQPYPSFSAPDARAFIPPVPYYPPYPYPYGYPPYGGYGLPLPIPGFGPGYGFGHGHGWHGGGHYGGGHHGGGHHR